MTPPRTNPITTIQPREFTIAAYLTMVAPTARAKSDRRTVAPVAMPNAAPEFFTNVRERNEPMTRMGSRCDRKLIAHDFVRKSMMKSAQAKAKM